jgi:nucleoid-associated protein YgaU
VASPTATIWVTIAAAAGTLVVVLAVIAGPSLLRCSSSAEGLLACMRQQVVDAGLLPAPETSPPPIAQPAEPAPPPAEPESPAPDLNLIRAEPDGSLIVAGSAPPGIEVEVFANGDLVGKAMVEASGDWVVVPDRPLAVGTAEISVGITGSNDRSPRTFTVVIPADKTSKPVVTPSDATAESVPTAEPDPASGPEPVAEAPSPADVPPVQSEPPPAVTEPVPVPTQQPLVVAEAEPDPKPVAEAPAPADAPPGQPEQSLAAAEPAPLPAEPPLVVAEAEPDPMPGSEPATQAPPPADVPPVQLEQPREAADAEPSLLPAQPPLVVAEAEPAAETPPVQPAITPVPTQPATIDAIEIDGSANYFAGAGPEGATVQLFVQNRFIASATVEGGRWLVEAEGVLNLPVQRVRIDLVRPQGTLSARAEVNFVIDVPPPAPEIQASATATGWVAPGASISTELAIAPQVQSEVEVDPAIPTLRAIPSADPAMLRFASGKAIIRRGETLWAIAARVYGDGSQYRRIVEANESISSPGRIFPGQVFDLPKLDESAPVN